jgi:hypothetical protein
VADAVIVDLSFTCGAHVGEAHALTPLGVIHAKDGDFVNSAHFGEDQLDLGGIDIDAAGDDEVATTALKIDVSVFVDATEVPDAEPVAVPRVVGLFRITPVLETGIAGGVTPEPSVRIASQNSSRAGSSDGSWVCQPLLGATARELSFG